MAQLCRAIKADCALSHQDNRKHNVGFNFLRIYVFGETLLALFEQSRMICSYDF